MEETRIVKNGVSYEKGSYRSIFEFEKSDKGLKVYIKSGMTVYEAVLSGKAVLDREEFCASRFGFTVLKDDVISFNQGDAVSVKYDGENIFFGFVFAKSRTKDALIEVTAYDQMRYLKNRRTYTRGRMTLDEIVRSIADKYALRTGEIERSGVYLLPKAADNVSLLDVIASAAAETEAMGGGRYILYDDAGYLSLKREEELDAGVYIDTSLAEDFLYRDEIDNGVYNTIEVYSDTKRLNIRSVCTASDSETMKKWGTLILSKKAENPENMAAEANTLLEKYDRVNREIILKGAAGNKKLMGGCGIYVSMTMGDLALSGKMRVKRAVHKFENNAYTADVYLDGSTINY